MDALVSKCEAEREARLCRQIYYAGERKGRRDGLIVGMALGLASAVFLFMAFVKAMGL